MGFLVGFAALDAVATDAQAVPVKGTVTMAAKARSGRRFEGYWRVENGTVPIAPAPVHEDPVVVLTGLKGAAPPARTVTVEIGGLMATPATVVIGPGSVVEFKNVGKTAHDLYSRDGHTMALQRLMPGALRHQKFGEVGGYEVRCAQYPHVSVSVVVVDSPYFAKVNDQGAFAIADVPEGQGTLKVWYQGRWVDEQPIEVKPGGRDVQIQVGEARGAAEKGAAE